MLFGLGINACYLFRAEFTLRLFFLYFPLLDFILILLLLPPHVLLQGHRLPPDNCLPSADDASRMIDSGYIVGVPGAYLSPISIVDVLDHFDRLILIRHDPCDCLGLFSSIRVTNGLAVCLIMIAE